jgi:hypothetical protein
MRAFFPVQIKPTPVKEAYRDSVQWFKEHGFISK